MKFVLKLFASIAVVLPGVIPVALYAHHSTAFYSDEVAEIEGELVGVKWRNPHVTWQLKVINDAGDEEQWNLEAASTYPLRRAGVTRDLFVIGDKIKVAGKRSKREKRVFLATNMLLPNGHELLLWGNIAAHFGDASRLVDAASENRGIFRVWSTPEELFPDIQRRLSHLPYSEAAIAGRAAWNPLDNFVMRCEQEGMPRIMVNPHPFEFIDNGTDITLRMELYDIVRTIHMDRIASPEDEPSSHLGFSTGSWEGNTLVIHTTKINWPYFDNIGTPQTEAIELVERFTLSENQGRIDMHITVTDPETFTEPGVITGYWVALGEIVPKYDCQPGRPGT